MLHTNTHRSKYFGEALCPIMAAPDMSRVIALDESHTTAATEFLASRPVQTVVMASFIADNGIVSELNRGRFFGHRDDNGNLDGVALIGHTTLVEARSEEALKALAFAARSSATPIHLIMSNGSDAERFHSYLTGGERSPRLTCAEDLFEAQFPFPVLRADKSVETARMDQLEEIAEAQAEIAFLECGIDPIVKDRPGFVARVARRIEHGRVFSVHADGKLIFKADIIAETSNTIYLEGIYVHPELRGKGLGPRYLGSLTRQLLGRVDHVCLLSNTEHTAAHRSFEKSGYRRTDQCVTVFV